MKAKSFSHCRYKREGTVDFKTIQSVKKIPPTTNGFEVGSCEPEK